MTSMTSRKPHRHWMASTLIGLTGLLSLAAYGPSLAHDDAYLDTLTAPHGGQIRMAGALHLELVVHKDGAEGKERPIEIYVTDHAGTKQATAGASGTVTSQWISFTENLFLCGRARSRPANPARAA